MIKGCKTIAEYHIRRWMEEQDFAGEFALEMKGNEATISDQAGGSLAVRYDPARRTVETTACP